jgi:DMSO/TMAO reductase YedYZ molybdopterin-dependent catalytic subunit
LASSSEAASGDGSAEVPWSQRNPLPNEDAEAAPAPGTRPEFTPLEEHYRIDINTISPSVDESEWRLTVQGLVDAPTELTLEDIRAYPPMHQFVTLSCISKTNLLVNNVDLLESLHCIANSSAR